MNPYQYIVSFAKGVGGIIRDASLILRPNFNDMANLSLTSPSNGSAVFNGSSDYAASNSVVNVQTQLGITNAFSVSAWVNVKDNGTYKGVASIWDNAADEVFGVWVDPSEKFHYFIRLSSGNAIYTSAATMPIGTWYYMTLTYDGANIRTYVNGSIDSTNAATGNVTDQFGTTPTGRINIGSQNGLAGVALMFGNLANVAIWNRALTSDEINSIMWKRYDLLTAGESTGLMAWYALDDITGTSVPDSTGTYNATAY